MSPAKWRRCSSSARRLERALIFVAVIASVESAMHESSLVKSLLRQVEAIRSQQEGLAVEEVRIEIGPLAR